MATIEDKARTVVCEQLGVEPFEVTPEAKFQDDLGADSLDVMELTMAFEEAFDIEISDSDADKVETFADVLKYLNSHVTK